MMFIRKTTPYFIIGVLIFICAQAGIALTDLKKSGNGEGQNPGYNEQWVREKRPSNGDFPLWQRNAWANWDKRRVRSRTSEVIIDAVYELGPKNIGGRTRSVWMDPRNENIMLAAAVSGGIWRSEDGGSNWVAINDHETSLMPSCLTYNPFNPDVIYYGTGEGRGNSSGYFVRSVNGNGVYKSTDGGKTFKVLSSTVGLTGLETIWDIKHSLDDESTLFVGTHTNGLFRSMDAGLTWEKVFNGGNQQVNNILVLPNNRILISLQSNQVYASDSAGKINTFKPVAFPAFPAPGKFRRIQMANCDLYPDVCYAMVEGYEPRDTPVAFYKSRDGGRNWEKMPKPSGVGAGQQGYCVMLGVHPTDSLRIVAGGVRISQSNDGGKTWQRKVIGHADHHGYAFCPQTKTEFVVATDGGMYRYKWDDTAVKKNLNNGYQVTQFYAGNFGATGAVSIGGTQDNGTQVSTGELTTLPFFGADGAYAHVGLQDGSVAYFSTQDTGIRRINNFNPFKIPARSDIKKILDPAFKVDGVDFINAYTMNPADQNQLYYRTNRFVYRSTNKGDNWVKITNVHGGMKALGVSEELNPVLYIGGSSAQLYKINNAATVGSGTEVVYNNLVPTEITNDYLNAITVNPKNRNTIYLAFSNYDSSSRIWKVTGMDGNNPVFTSLGGDLPPNLPVNYVATDPEFPDKNLFAATDFGLYYSTDSGKIWTKEKRIPNVCIHEIKMRKDRILFVYTHGRGMWAVQLKRANPLLPNDAAIKIFPNPAKDQVRIEFTTFEENASFSVYNSVGQLVDSGNFSEHTYWIETSRYRSGYYFFKVTISTGSLVEKIIIQ